MKPLPEPFVTRLQSRFGERFTTGQALREQHAGGGMHLPALPPQAVIFAQSIDEIVEAVRAAAEYGVPIVPFGAGTSLECNVGAARGGVSIDLSQMTRVLRVSVEDQDCTVEAGVTRTRLNEHLRDTGLFFPVDPGADATIGGMASTRASGTTTIRYGGMRENVLGLTVVTADGRVMRTARRARKSAAGYDLTHLFVGAEGTLGIIADVTLRLHAQPEAASAAVCDFADTAGAVSTVIESVQSGVPLARAEYLDAAAISAVNRAFGENYAERETLFLEFHGSPSEVKSHAERVGEIAAAHGGGEFKWAQETEARNRLWRARHHAGFAVAAMRPGALPWSTDVCVPISALAECVVETKADLAAAPFPSAVLGHIGDGNFHAILLIDTKNEDEIRQAEQFNDRLVARALAMDGTCTGEHGVGLGKRESLEAELGEAVDVMRAIKRALDPTELMNPEKIFVP
jgi:D-lactate dehydrogenase (cytochrome)